jgi:hypothetical protein
MLTYSGGTMLTYHGGGVLGPAKFNSYTTASHASPGIINASGLPSLHNYHGSGFNLGRWLKKAAHSVVHWTKGAAKTVGKFARKEGPAILHTIEKAGVGAARGLASALPALAMGNYVLAGAQVAGGAAQGALSGDGFSKRGKQFSNHARAPKRARRY